MIHLLHGLQEESQTSWDFAAGEVGFTMALEVLPLGNTIRRVVKNVKISESPNLHANLGDLELSWADNHSHG